ncbi:hypothetical protein GLW08_20375 [Pontibacillus yanchengensis]|uniref:Uncharacterized protein n=2 Tax=Pontibacillus yanchengensis TaxID=462910 RepID=A0ACC7VL06_9BACI|nr:hypothetical protein [Pontibacillus yanchengensis]MYL35461.1 hypothetical protein [Pontibacillus yanchengensis]MYL55661.1 hypothetical protein [Pontibacillus yanchengensis]
MKKKIMLAFAILILTVTCIFSFNVQKNNASKALKPVQELSSNDDTKKALNSLPITVKEKLKVPKKLPFDTKNTDHYAKTRAIGKNYYFQEIWSSNNMSFEFNVINDTPKIPEIDDSEFNVEKDILTNGIEAVYIKGPNAEKIYWNDNGFQYMLIHIPRVNERKAASDNKFLGIEKLQKTAEKIINKQG